MFPWFALGIAAPIGLALAVKALRDPNKWYGQMECNKCDYYWQSRRSTPPARCPKCSSTKITPIKG